MYRPQFHIHSKSKLSLRFLIALALVMPSFAIKAAPKGTDAERFKPSDFTLKCEMKKTSLYEQEPVEVNVVLCSPTPNVVGVSEIRPMSLNKGEFSFFSPVRSAGESYVVNEKGRKVYCYVVQTAVLSVGKKGKYELECPELQIEVAYPVVTRDPFWGYVQSSETVAYELKGDNTEFKVRELPKLPEKSVYSGAIGEFSIKTEVPPGDIVVNEEATAYVTISGIGWLPDTMLPEYRDAFKKGMKLKSISEERNRYVKDGRLISELRIECTFIPTERTDVEIGPITFEYFNPKTGKFVEGASEPTKVTVKSTTVRREIHSV